MTKQEVIQGMMRNEKIFVIFSLRTRMPFVACDPETFDDQIYLYLTEEEATAEAKRMTDAGDPVGVYVMTTQAFLPFYMNLYFIGINRIIAGQNTDSCYAIQLTEFVRRELKDNDPMNPRTVENPELSLTMLYFIQELAKKTPDKKAIADLDEEMKADFHRAKFLMPFQEDNNGILLEKDGHKYQPLFTDFFEFDKFSRGKKLKVLVVETTKLIQNFPKNAEGVAINPSGVNVVLNIGINRNNETAEV